MLGGRIRQLSATAGAVLAANAVLACSDPLEPYEDITAPRLLAIAADAPDLVPGAVTTITPLLTAPATETRWSWCPLIGSANDGFPCVVEHELLQSEVDKALGAGQITVPAYDLGDGATAEFAHNVPPQAWEELCDILQRAELPPLAEFPRCGESFPITIRLEASFGATSVIGTRKVELLYDTTSPVNKNPALGAMMATELALGTVVPLDDLGSAELVRDTAYKLELELAEGESETYLRDPGDGSELEQAREILRLSWFHEGGELDVPATSFTDGSTVFSDARSNEWRTPSQDERDADTSRLFVVVRDNRGGTSWVTTSVRFNR